MKYLLLIVSLGLTLSTYAQTVGSFYGSTDGTESTDIKIGKKSTGGTNFIIRTQDPGGSSYLRFHSYRWGAGYTWSREHSDGVDRNIAYLYGSDSGNYFQLFKDSNQEITLQLHSKGDSYFNGGNVGIGTDSPNASLHIPNGTAIVGGTNSLSLSHVNNSLGVISKDNNSSTYTFYVGQNSGADLFWVKGNGDGFFKGQVGIGTASPHATLHVPDGTAIVGGPSSLNLAHLNNSLGVISKDDNSSTYPFYVGQPSGADIFWVRGNGNGFFKGQVGIGTSTTGSHKLAVEGTIGAREIKVEASGWSDFVFEHDYDLRTLEEVEKHIEENGHLPEIPNEAEVTENGINLGEMNAKLLQKIEEVTLYLIEQNKRLDAQQKEIKDLKAQINN